MSNESSIEWIIKQLIFKTEFENLPNQYVLMSDKDISSIIEQAKAMEKQQRMSDFSMGIRNAIQMEATKDAEQWFIETFGGNNEQQ